MSSRWRREVARASVGFLSRPVEMSAITLGPSGLPIQLTPVLPQSPPVSLLQPPAPQPPTAVPAVDRQTNSSQSKDALNRRETNHPPPSHGRGRAVDVTA
jgi:hypothetical protein